MTIRYIAIVAAAASVLTYQASAEKKIDRSALPSAVEKTVQAESQGSTIKGFSIDHENGQTQYEVEMISNGHSKDIAIARDGTLLEVEEEIAFDSLPDNVKIALKARANTATITKVESLTKKNNLVAYEAATLKGSKKGEIQVGPHGEKLSHEE
ncbi:MAG: PepSY domain-containing protein [Edaphobacter sp.]